MKSPALQKFVAEVKAMTREAVNDVRGTMHQAYFGQPEHTSEIGTPMHPTPGQVYDDLTKGMDQQPSYQPQRDQDYEMGQ